MKIKPKSFFLIFILLLMALTGGMAAGFGRYEAMLAPLLLSISIFVLGAIELIRELRSKDKELPPIEDDEEIRPTVVAAADESGQVRRFFMALGWIGGFVLGIYVLGFFLSSLLFAVSYLKTRGQTWLSAGVFALCFTGALYAVFEMAFQSHLYRGLVFGG